MLNTLKRAGMAAILPISIAFSASTVQADTIRIALAETPSDELAAFFVALDRAKANGLDYEWTAFSDEELAIQAVLSGQMDIGFGTPYAAMQRSKAPVRIIFQLSKLKFFPVTTKKYSELSDLDGEPILLHSRGGGNRLDRQCHRGQDGDQVLEIGLTFLARQTVSLHWSQAKRMQPSSISRTRTR